MVNTKDIPSNPTTEMQTQGTSHQPYHRNADTKHIPSTLPPKRRLIILILKCLPQFLHKISTLVANPWSPIREVPHRAVNPAHHRLILTPQVVRFGVTLVEPQILPPTAILVPKAHQEVPVFSVTHVLPCDYLDRGEGGGDDGGVEAFVGVEGIEGGIPLSREI